MGKIVKIILIFIIISGIVLLLELGLRHLGKGQLEKFGIEELPSLEPISLEKEEKVSKEFITPDNKLKLVYSSDWIEMESKNLGEAFLGERVEKYNSELLFFTIKGQIKSFGQLMVEEMVVEPEKEFEEIINEMKESNLQQGWEMEIINSETNKNEITFEAKYQKPDRLDVHSKERLVFLEPKEKQRKVYSVAFIALDKDWEEFSQEADSIFNSIQLLQ
jgi:hypothetical protein